MKTLREMSEEQTVRWLSNQIKYFKLVHVTRYSISRFAYAFSLLHHPNRSCGTQLSRFTAITGRKTIQHDPQPHTHIWTQEFNRNSVWLSIFVRRPPTWCALFVCGVVRLWGVYLVLLASSLSTSSSERLRRADVDTQYANKNNIIIWLNANWHIH